jgi:hypothetical protein
MVSNFGATIVGNTRKIDKQLKMAITSLWFDLKEDKTFLSSKGMIVGIPLWSRFTKIPLWNSGSG